MSSIITCQGLDLIVNIILRLYQILIWSKLWVKLHLKIIIPKKLMLNTKQQVKQSSYSIDFSYVIT